MPARSLLAQCCMLRPCVCDGHQDDALCVLGEHCVAHAVQGGREFMRSNLACWCTKARPMVQSAALELQRDSRRRSKDWREIGI